MYLNRILIAATLLCFFGGTAHATLLVYEGFGYADGDLNGQGATNTFGMTGVWNTDFATGNPAEVHSYSTQGVVSGTAVTVVPGLNSFDGTVANLPTSGGYVGSGPPATPGAEGNTTDHMGFSRSLDPSVTATFTDGSTTWFSHVYARAFSANASAAKFTIGAGNFLEDRGHRATGEGIGGGGGLGPNVSRLYPQFWDEETAGSGNFQDFDHTGLQPFSGGSGITAVTDTFIRYSVVDGVEAVPNIIVGKIDWSDTGPDVISYAVFSQDDVLSEAAFDALVLANSTTSAGWTTQPDLDQSQFDTIAFAGGRYFVDELRIGTTFNDIIGAAVESAVVPEPSTFTLLLLASVAALGRRRATRVLA
jgi:hypothetical protein